MTDGEGGVPCVGAVVHDSAGRLLLVRRANEPGRGRWSVPGGRVEAGEDDAAALVREVAEETGLAVEPGPLVGGVRRGPYAITDYRATVTGGTLLAGDDALEVRWCSAADLARLPLVDGLLEALAEWDALPRDAPAGVVRSPDALTRDARSHDATARVVRSRDAPARDTPARIAPTGDAQVRDARSSDAPPGDERGPWSPAGDGPRSTGP
jgi:8-oxo-dGTP diphosphatase